MTNQLSLNDYYKAKIKGVNLINAKISRKNFEDCRFSNCTFINCVWENCKFIDCSFIICRLSAIIPYGCLFNGIKITDSKITGFDWTKAKKVSDLTFKNSDLSYSNFSCLKLNQLKLINCLAKEVSFIEADLAKSNFRGTDFDQAIFHKTDLSQVDFSKAINYQINLNINQIKNAKFDLPEAIELLRCSGINLD